MRFVDASCYRHAAPNGAWGFHVGRSFYRHGALTELEWLRRSYMSVDWWPTWNPSPGGAERL
jgi:hypothetical protein